MYRILKCTADTYIQNRIIDDSFRATDANVGRAGTLDLFKLYDESILTGSTTPIELSRLLVKFDLNQIRALTGSNVDVGSSRFKCYIRLTDVLGGQPVPSNFTVAIHPLSKSFDEGIGRNVSRYTDLDAANWITASVSAGTVPWTLEGANASGAVGSTTLDIIETADFGAGSTSVITTQTFTDGSEDLLVDVTTVVSATLAGYLPDHGFRIAMSGTLESNDKTLFVKRFASRHASNPLSRPALLMLYDDSLRDNHKNFEFDVTGSLYLYNTVRGQARNLVSGTAAIQLTGSSALTLTLISGAIAPAASSSYSATFDVDQVQLGVNYLSGTYVATFAISSVQSQLRREVQAAGSASFTAIWGTNDGTVAYLSESFTIERSQFASYVAADKQLRVTMPGIKMTYRTSQQPRIRVNVFDTSKFNAAAYKFSKLPVENSGIVIDRMHWRIVDVYSGEIVVPWDTTYDSTRVSTDSRGMYFDFFPYDLPIGRVYGFEFLIQEFGDDVVIDKHMPTFRIEA